MKRGFIKNAILFIFIGSLLLFVMNKIIIFGARNVQKSLFGKVNKICSKNNDAQIAFFSSSVGEVGINAAKIQKSTNLKSYNYSFNGTSYAQYSGLIEEYLKNQTNTKIIVLGETYFTFTARNKIANIEYYLSNINNNNVYNALYDLQPDLAFKCRYIPMYKYIACSHTFYQNVAEGWKSYLKKTIPDDSLLGQSPVDKPWEMEEDVSLLKAKKYEVDIDAKVVQKYNKTIASIKSKGITPIIVLMPIYTQVSKLITDFAPVRNTLQKIAAENNVVFLDYTTISICKNKNYFYNSNHLNNIGSNVFSQILADTLLNIKEQKKL